MLSSTSASALELLTASGSQPTAQWNVRGKVTRTYDSLLRSYTLACEGGPTTRLALPKDERKSLALTHSVLVLQLALSRDRPFSFELTMSDAAGTRRHVLVTYALVHNALRALVRREVARLHGEPISTPLHTRLPLLTLPRGTWVNLVLDLGDLMDVFFATQFTRLDGISLVLAPLS
ncbi:hypothetical protein T492DRAFT_876870 [Pavlovales sp. CCMP2436]|nr:hypothetical protein T492DRAFT_876870 [Pavlovales sp. CCMP2436]